MHKRYLGLAGAAALLGAWLFLARTENGGGRSSLVPSSVSSSGQAESARTARVADEVVLSTRLGAREKAEAAARAAAGELTDSGERLAAHEALLAEALARDAREAVAWVLGLEDRQLAAVLIDQALAAWAEVDAAAAGAHVAALPLSDYRTMLAGELAAAWAAQDGAAATAWAAALGDQEAREEALGAALSRVAEANPRAAAELALRAPGEGERAAMLERVVERWWRDDMAAVEAWAAGLMSEADRAGVARLVAARREAEVGEVR